MAQLAVVLVMATPLRVMVSGAPCATTDDPLQPAPKATVGAALVKRKLAGNDSTKPMPDWAGFDPVLVKVNISVVDAPSTMVAAPHALVSTGGTALTTTHCVVTPFATPASGAILLLVLLKAAGFAPQLGLVKPVRLVTAVTVIVQLGVVAAIVTLLNAMVSGAACVTTDEPAQPAPNTTDGAPLLKRNDAGNDSVNEMPLCAGLVPLLVSVKMRFVVPASLIVDADHALVKVGLAGFTTRHWSVEAFVAPVLLTFTLKLVNAAGLPTQDAFVCVGALVKPATVTVQVAVVSVIATPEIPESTRVIPA